MKMWFKVDTGMAETAAGFKNTDGFSLADDA